MFDDPIIEEVRQIRDQLAARFNYDVKAIGAYYRAMQEREAIPVVTRTPRPSAISDQVAESEDDTDLEQTAEASNSSAAARI